jgi:hypothetical protein
MPCCRANEGWGPEFSALLRSRLTFAVIFLHDAEVQFEKVQYGGKAVKF